MGSKNAVRGCSGEHWSWITLSCWVHLRRAERRVGATAWSTMIRACLGRFASCLGMLDQFHAARSACCFRCGPQHITPSRSRAYRGRRLDVRRDPSLDNWRDVLLRCLGTIVSSILGALLIGKLQRTQCDWHKFILFRRLRRIPDSRGFHVKRNLAEETQIDILCNH